VISDSDASALGALGLTPGEQVRFRRTDRGRWQLGAVQRLERDGSLRVADAEGSARTVPLAGVQVRAPRTRGAGTWEPLAERSSRAVQLSLSL
jgi:hypothetical protein